MNALFVTERQNWDDIATKYLYWKQAAKQVEAERDGLLEALRDLLSDCEAEAIRRGFRPEDFDNIKGARAAIAAIENKHA